MKTVEELAGEAGIKSGHEPKGGSLSLYVPKHYLERFAALVRAQALEEAIAPVGVGDDSTYAVNEHFVVWVNPAPNAAPPLTFSTVAVTLLQQGAEIARINADGTCHLDWVEIEKKAREWVPHSRDMIAGVAKLLMASQAHKP